jgi:hypothetical protein
MQLLKAAFFVHSLEAGKKKETPFVSERGHIQTVITNTTLNIALSTRQCFLFNDTDATVQSFTYKIQVEPLLKN